jgi:NTE family protein
MGSAGTPRVGLVLGAGGVLGAAWLQGALAALVDATGWDPGSAERIVGTSAGSVIGTLLACGVPPWYMVAHSAGESFDGLLDAAGDRASDVPRSAGAELSLDRALPVPGPGSWRLALGALKEPRRLPPAAVLAGWIPRGFISTQPIQDVVRAACSEDWAPHPGLRVVACDYATGKRVPFGAPGCPPATLPEAVAASCAIPGFYVPPRIGGRTYVDGGLWSVSNLDLVARENLDLVICLNPTSSRDSAGSLPGRVLRAQAGRRLGHEAKRVRWSGASVVLIQPVAEDLEVMGENLMAGRRRHAVIERARQTTTWQLRALRAELDALPAGAPPFTGARPARRHGGPASRRRPGSASPRPEGSWAARGSPTSLVGLETMIFTTKAEYGVRLMVELGRQAKPGGAATSLKVIAEAEALPLAYLERIVALLKKAGLVESTRGAHGGYRLRAPAADVRMDEVILALEGTWRP